MAYNYSITTTGGQHDDVIYGMEGSDLFLARDKTRGTLFGGGITNEGDVAETDAALEVMTFIQFIRAA